MTPPPGPQGTETKLKDTISGITASTTQTQGQQPLTAALNEISTVANLDDVVTLPSAIPGLEITIINNGANTLQIFPASGDDLGNGVNASTELEPNEEIEFISYDGTNWGIEASTEIFHAEFHDEDNADAYVINAAANFQGYHSNGLVAGDLAGFTYDEGGAGTSFPIASIADDGGGNILVTTTGAHGLAVGDVITQSNLADAAYEGVFKVLTVPLTTTYTVTAVFTATDTGTMDQPASLKINDIALGAFAIDYSLSGSPATNGDQFDFEIYCDAIKITGTKRTSKFGNNGDFRVVAGCGIFTIPSDGRISLILENQDSAGNFTIEDISVRLIRL